LIGLGVHYSFLAVIFPNYISRPSIAWGRILPYLHKEANKANKGAFHMSDCTVTDVDERVFHLSVTELVAAIFHGPDADGWAAIFEVGLPELVARAPQKLDHLMGLLKNLQDSQPMPLETVAKVSLLETEYVRLFISASGGVTASLYESCHLGAAPRIMGDSALSMRSRLNECGLEIALDSNEPPDHISIELEYLYYLFATAWAEEDVVLEVKAREFTRLEMVPWIRRFRDKLAQGEPHPVYLNTADLTVALLKELGG